MGDLIVTGVLMDQRLLVAKEQSVVFREARVERVDFSGQRLDSLHANAVSFIDCDFSDVKLGRFRPMLGVVKPVLFHGCSFDRAEFSNLSLGSSRFEGCTFRGTKLTGLESRCAEWVDNTFATRISRCQFYGRPQQPCATTIDGSTRSVNAFVGNDFSAAELSDCGFRHGIDLHRQRWPITRAYRVLDHWALRHASAQQVLVRESPSVRRDRLERALEIVSPSRYGEGQDFLLQPDSFGWLDGDERHELVDLLTKQDFAGPLT